MAADVDDTLPEWSVTESSNKPTGGTAISTNLDDNQRMQQKVVRAWLAHKGSDIASAATADLGAVEGSYHDITGTAGISSFGTISAGIHKVLKFEGALTLTNSTSLILLTGANRTTVAGDVGWYISEGSGNWRELFYMPINTQLTNSGVKFAATQAASSDANTLDDYEEGTWTPVLTFATAGDLNVAYTTQLGTYTKIGRLVTAYCEIVTSTFTHTTASGNCQVTGLPFTAAAGMDYTGSLQWQGVSKANYTDINPQVGAGTAVITFLAHGSGQARDNVAAANMPTTGTVILIFSLSYHV